MDALTALERLGTILLGRGQVGRTHKALVNSLLFSLDRVP
jgi:hypothetical protein